MLSSDGNKMVIKSIGLISKKKKKTLHAQHTFFLYISLMLFCTTTTWNFLVRHLMWEVSYVLTRNFVARVPDFQYLRFFFFHCHSFLPALSWLLAFLISYHQFSCFSSNKICLRCFLSNMLALSLFSTSLKTFKI